MIREQDSSTLPLYNCFRVHFLNLTISLQKNFSFFSICRSSEDLIHRLFVCIAGVADQLQTNFAGDLRNILQSVFLMNATDSDCEEQDNVQYNISNGSGKSKMFDRNVTSTRKKLFYRKFFFLSLFFRFT